VCGHILFLVIVGGISKVIPTVDPLINFGCFSEHVWLKEAACGELVLFDDGEFFSHAEFIEVFRVLNTKERACNRYLRSFLSLFRNSLKLIKILGGKVCPDLGQICSGQSHNLILLNVLHEFGQSGWHFIRVHLLLDHCGIGKGFLPLIGGHVPEVVECFQITEFFLAW